MKKQKTDDTMNPSSQPQDPPSVREIYELDTTQKVGMIELQSVYNIRWFNLTSSLKFIHMLAWRRCILCCDQGYQESNR